MNRELQESLSDSVASLTDWKPLVPGGANYRTAELVTVSPQRVEYRPTFNEKLFSILCLVVGVGCVVGGAFMQIQSDDLSIPGLFLIPLGIFLLVACIVQLRSASASCVFDLDAGLFCRGKVAAKDQGDRCISLQRVYAIQLLREKIRYPQSKYSTYELNLVLDDASRRNVVDHGDIKRLRKEADLLSKLLGVPLWDATPLKP